MKCLKIIVRLLTWPFVLVGFIVCGTLWLTEIAWGDVQTFKEQTKTFGRMLLLKGLDE